MFLNKFSTIGEIAKTRGDLTNVKQCDGNLLFDYLERFKKVYDKIEGLSQDTIMTYFEGGLRSHALKMEFLLHRLQTFGEMFKTTKHVALGIEQSDQKLNSVKSVVDVSKTRNPKFDSRLETPKQFTNKEKTTFSGLNKNNSKDKGKN